MSGALPKGWFWREVRYTDQEWARQGRGGSALHASLAFSPRQFTPAQVRRMRKKKGRTK